tara:strand:- start:10761 stop:12887 length:2127 start_codon:yes stop_codon:yes gene_type:complete
MATKKVNIDIIARDKTKAALGRVQGSLNNVKKSVFSLKSAIIGIGAVATIKSFVDVGREVESLETRFKFLFGSVEEGKVAFDQLRKFASRVPFSLEEISRASGNLAVVSKDAEDLNRVLSITGNVAAVTGLDFETTASQIQRAFSGGIGAADLFRERGVRALLGFKAGVQVTAEETIERFEELFGGNGKFATATDDLATTLTGTLSMLGDKFFNFQTVVASKFFDELKKEFGDLDKFLEENEQQIEDIATAIGENFAGAITKTSKAIKDVAPAVKSIADALGTTITGFQSLPTFVQSSGIIAALLFGKKGLVAFGAVSFLVGQIQDLISEAKTVSELKLLDPSQIDNIEELNLLIKQFKKERADIVADMRDPDSVIPLDVLEKEFNDVNASIEKLQKRIQTIHLDEIVNQQMEEFEKATGRATEAIKKQSDAIVDLDKIKKDLEDEKAKQIKLQMFLQEHQHKRVLEFHRLEKEGVKKHQKLQLFILEQANKKRLEFNELVSEGVKKFQEQDNIQGQVLKKIKEQNEDFSISDEIVGFINNGVDSFSKGLAEALILGKSLKNTFSNMAKALLVEVLTAVIRIVAQKGVELAIEKLITKEKEKQRNLSAASGNPLAILSFLGGFFADGGRPPVGRPSIVGEKGAELFVPDQAGTIIPNNQLGMSQPVTVNFNINTVDARGFNELLINSRGVIVNMINSAVNEKGKEALI